MSKDEFLEYSIPYLKRMFKDFDVSTILNSFLWQAAYSEFVFIDALWPDFDEKELDKAIAEYQSRDRRYGAVASGAQQ